MSVSSPPLRHHRSTVQATIRAALRQLLGALFFDLGVCISGRHRVRDRAARAKCCNGFRGSWISLFQDGSIVRHPTVRPITFADPRFSWEPEPDLIPGYQSCVNPKLLRRRRSIPDRPFGPPSLSLIDAHVAGGGAL